MGKSKKLLRLCGYSSFLSKKMSVALYHSFPAFRRIHKHLNFFVSIFKWWVKELHFCCSRKPCSADRISYPGNGIGFLFDLWMHLFLRNGSIGPTPTKSFATIFNHLVSNQTNYLYKYSKCRRTNEATEHSDRGQAALYWSQDRPLSVIWIHEWMDCFWRKNLRKRILVKVEKLLKVNHWKIAADSPRVSRDNGF